MRRRISVSVSLINNSKKEKKEMMQFFVDFSSFTGKINKEFFSDVTARKQLFRIQVKSLYPSPSSISLYYNRPFEQYYAQINVKSVLRHLRSYFDNDRNFTSSMNETS